ncbi:MAG: DUF4118 domain-containing protein [Spirochaetes bacterium]|nr:DUF4118 domain-containing protein [Spirochaetota bacterium]
MAVYIQTSKELADDENNLLKKNIQLVKDLGGVLVSSMDDNIPQGIMRVARQHAISHIVVGKPLGYSSSGIMNKTNIIDTLINISGEIDIFVISEQSVRPKKRKGLSILSRTLLSGKKIEYLYATLWLLILIVINLYLISYISYLSVGFIFLAAVAVVSSYYKKGTVLYFASISAVLWNFLFIKPRYTIYIDHLEDLFMFLMYFITAFIVGNLTTKLRLKEIFLRKREKNLEELYMMGKILNESNHLDEILDKSTTLLRNIFDAKIAVFLVDDRHGVSFQSRTGNDFIFPENERDVILWCFENRKPSGRNTGVMSRSKYHYIPLHNHAIQAGVMAIDYTNKSGLSIEQENLLSALVSQITSALERDEFIKTQQKIKLAEESERLYQILLNSVSHELRTPITTIATSASGLIDEKLSENEEVRKIFATDIIESSDRLNRIVDNLLGSLRIESEKITLNLEWYDISELASHVRGKLDAILNNHDFTVHIDNSMPMLKFDFMLMEQLLTNLVYNAILYTPSGSKIQLNIEAAGNMIYISVIDNGPGIPDEEKDKIFDKFYRAKKNKKGGMGLGLSICKEISEIHGGTISVTTGINRGAHFTAKLPLQQSTIHGELK